MCPSFVRALEWEEEILGTRLYPGLLRVHNAASIFDQVKLSFQLSKQKKKKRMYCVGLHFPQRAATLNRKFGKTNANGNTSFPLDSFKFPIVINQQQEVDYPGTRPVYI